MVRHLILTWVKRRSKHKNWCKILNNPLQHLDQILKLNFWCKSDAQLHSENFIDWEGAFKKNWCCCAKQHIYLRTKLKLRIRMLPLCDGIARSGRWRRGESLDSLNSGNGKCKDRSNIININHWVVLGVMPPCILFSFLFLVFPLFSVMLITPFQIPANQILVICSLWESTCSWNQTDIFAPLSKCHLFSD